MNRLKRKPVDKIPNLNILMTFAGRYIDVSYDKYCQDYRYLVEGNIKCSEAFGIDMVCTVSDPYREAHDFGMELEFPYDNLPICRKHLLNGPGDLKKVKLFNPHETRRMQDRIKAVELFKKEIGGYYPITGWVEGPIAEASDLRGIYEFMIDLYEEPEFVEELMNICCEEAIICAREQVKAGCDFIGIGDSAASLVSPKTYSELVVPMEKRIVDEIHKLGAKAKLHICGNISNLLDYVCDTGADIVDIDWMVDFKTAVKKTGGRCCINGNIDPVRVVYEGTPDMVRAEIEKLTGVIDANSCISAGCEVPKFTPYENLKAFDDALRHISKSL